MQYNISRKKRMKKGNILVSATIEKYESKDGMSLVFHAYTQALDVLRACQFSEHTCYLQQKKKKNKRCIA
jgi:hypothetical protein